jgi:hypothetical protein
MHGEPERPPLAGSARESPHEPERGERMTIRARTRPAGEKKLQNEPERPPSGRATTVPSLPPRTSSAQGLHHEPERRNPRKIAHEPEPPLPAPLPRLAPLRWGFLLPLTRREQNGNITAG